MLQVAPDLCVVYSEQATLLGSAIGGEASVESTIRTKTKAWVPKSWAVGFVICKHTTPVVSFGTHLQYPKCYTL